jgi:hypothetical protein
MANRMRLQVTEGKPILRGHDHFWSVIRSLDRRGPWAVPDIEAASRDHRASVIGFVHRLVRGGIAKAVGERPVGIRGHRAKTYRLIKRPAETPQLRRDGTPAERGRGVRQMWTAMRQLPHFTVRELAVAASTDDCVVAERSASSYVQHLIGAEYLAVIDRGGRGRAGTYRLKRSMNTGPKAPMVLQTRVIWDSNRGCAAGDVIADEARL